VWADAPDGESEGLFDRRCFVGRGRDCTEEFDEVVLSLELALSFFSGAALAAERARQSGETLPDARELLAAIDVHGALALSSPHLLHRGQELIDRLHDAGAQPSVLATREGQAGDTGDEPGQRGSRVDHVVEPAGSRQLRLHSSLSSA
jgi:hypothetical protein